MVTLTESVRSEVRAMSARYPRHPRQICCGSLHQVWLNVTWTVHRQWTSKHSERLTGYVFKVGRCGDERYAWMPEPHDRVMRGMLLV